MASISNLLGSKSRDSEFDAALIRHFASHQHIGAIATCIVTIAVAAVIWDHVPMGLLLPWAGAQIAIALLSRLRWQQFRQLENIPANSQPLIIEAMLWKALTGAWWGLLAVFTYVHLPHSLEFFTTIAVAAMAVGGITTMAALTAAANAFILLSFVPFIGYWLLGGDTASVTLGLLAILLLGLVINSARIAHGQILSVLQAEFGLRQVSDEYRAARGEWVDLSDTTEAYVVFDPQDKLLSWNERYAELLQILRELLHRGTPRMELIKRGLKPVEFANGEISVEQWLKKRIDAESRGHSETFLREFEGGIWIQRRIRYSKNGHKVVSHVDLTEFVKMERALKESEERYRLIAENSPDAILVHVEDQIVYANPAAIKMFRAHSETDLLGVSLVSITHPDDHKSVLSNRARMAEKPSEALPIIRVRMRRLDGTYVETAGSGAHHTWQGKPAVLVTRRDITAVIHAEKALRESEEKLRAIVENMPGSIVLKDLDLRIRLAAGRNYGQWSGIDPIEAIGKTATDIVSEDIAAELEECDREILESGEVVDMEINTETADGKTRTFLSTRFPVKDGAGTTIGVGIINQEVTDQRQTEAQLQQAQKMEVVGQLTGGIAHDFNNLLTVILGNAELLSEHIQGKPEAEHLLQNALRSAQRGADLTQRLLAFSRRQNLHPEPVDINARMAEMVPLLQHIMPATISLQTKIAEDIPFVQIDPTQLESAIMNLAINARDAISNDGEIELAACIVKSSKIPGLPRKDRKTDEYVLVTVTDTGSGMSKDVREHAFEPFFTTKPVGSGSGLGLSMVYGFVTQSGGHIAIESAPRQGDLRKTISADLRARRCGRARGSA